ncbi:MAG: protein kinase, partial [Anaerolineae bacterium]|nr:protein kinase [Anaerolineae bacterium]
MSNMIGHIINDRYELQSLLGDGGMGTVYRAQDRNLNRQVAIKLMHPHFARRQEFRNRLIQEARVSAKLDHSSIVRIFDFGDSNEGLFITMEYVDGGSLRAHLRRLQQE